MNSIGILMLVAALGLAGCLGDAQEREIPVEGAGTMAASSPLETEACWEAAGRFEVPLEDARQLVPPGFEVTRAGQLGDKALLFVSGSECRVFTGTEDAGTDVQIHSLILVEPPPQFAVDSDAFIIHGVIVDWLTSNEAVADRYESWNLPHTRTSAAATLTGDTPASRVAQFEAESGSTAWSLDGVAAGPSQPFGAGHGRAFYVYEDGDSKRLAAVDVTWEGIPNAALGGGTFMHPTFGALSSADMFHAWPYDIRFSLVEFGPLPGADEKAQ